jgi:hypothetical protein
MKAADTDPVLVFTDHVVAKESEVEEESEVASGQSPVISYQLAQNYPNPFWSGAKSRSAGNPGTVINFALPLAGRVTLNVYNEIGQLVYTLVDHEMAAGQHSLYWNGQDQLDNTVAAGIYLYRIAVRGNDGRLTFTQTRSMTLLQ